MKTKQQNHVSLDKATRSPISEGPYRATVVASSQDAKFLDADATAQGFRVQLPGRHWHTRDDLWTVVVPVELDERERHAAVHLFGSRGFFVNDAE